jgi:hypothetical protein
MEIVQYPHDDVASYALSAAIARNPDQLQAILKIALKSKNYNCKKIADYMLKIGDTDVIKTIKDNLINQKLAAYKVPYPEEYYRDILVYSLLRQAREKNEKVVIPKNIEFTWGQKVLLKYADKPENEAWNDLYPILAELKKENDAAFAIIFALSAYSQVFFDEAMTKIHAKETPQTVKKILRGYLEYNQARLNKDQITQLEQLKKQ